MKKILIGVGALIAMVVIYAIYSINKPPRNIVTAKEDIEITSPNLYSEFSDNENKANEKYLDKLILVSGKINEITLDDSSNVNLYLNVASDDFGAVSCNFNPLQGHKALNYKPGMVVKVKGICSGFVGTDLISDVVLSKCVIVD